MFPMSWPHYPAGEGTERTVGGMGFAVTVSVSVSGLSGNGYGFGFGVFFWFFFLIRLSFSSCGIFRESGVMFSYFMVSIFREKGEKKKKKSLLLQFV